MDTALPTSPADSQKPTNGSDKATAVERKQYVLDKWRFPGVVGLVLLNIIGGMNWPWFGSIAPQTALDFNISVSQVNWLGNVVNLVFVPGSIATAMLCSRFGLRSACFIGAALIALAGWIRYAGTASHLSPQGAYALLFIGQVLAGVAQPVFQVVAPKFSEAWFDFNGRTTAIMIISVANPVGSALGQFLPALCTSTRTSILVLAVISSAMFPASFLIYSKPPTPPTFSGAQPSRPPLSVIRSLINRPRDTDRSLSLRSRIDFVIIVFAFGVLVAAANAVSLLSVQLFGPYGYSSLVSGLFSAILILAGLAAAIITAPLFDRVLSRHVSLTVKIVTPLLGLSWLSLIWAVRPHNTNGLFAVMAIIGVLSLTLLPLSLDLGSELSGSAETSAAILWSSANLFGVIFVLIEPALKASADASPPENMRNATIFVAVVVCTAAIIVVLGFKGLPDSRRSLDAAKEEGEFRIELSEAAKEA